VARYGQAFKDRVVARLLPPESAGLDAVAREIGVGVSTLERWRSDALSMPARERAWTAAARFDAVLTTASLGRSRQERLVPRAWGISADVSGMQAGTASAKDENRVLEPCD
jgi:transposase-like protein